MMADVLNTRLMYVKDGHRAEAQAGDPVPPELDAETAADMQAKGLIVDEADFVNDGERPWAVEAVASDPSAVHTSQGLNPAQPGDTETPGWQDTSVANQPTTAVEGTAPAPSPTTQAEPAPGVAAVQAALAAQAPAAEAPEVDTEQEGGAS